jgi:hypothetical protein
MALQSGVLLPFFLLGVVIVLAFVDLLGTAKSTSVMTAAPTRPLPDRPVPGGVQQR